MRGWFWWMRPLKNYSQHLLQQTSLFLDVSWKVLSVGDSAAVIHRLFSLFTFINKCAAVWMSRFRNSVNLMITCICNLLPSSVQSVFCNAGTDSFPGKKISRRCCRPPYWSNSKLFRASHQLFKSLESMRHRTAGPLSPPQPCGLIQLPWNTRGEFSCHRKLKQVTDSHMNRITRLCSITHDARAQMYSWKSAVGELFQGSTHERQHSRSHCPIHTHGGMNSGVRCECLQTCFTLDIYIV